MADFCTDPDTNALGLIRERSPNRDITNTTHYATCNKDNVFASQLNTINERSREVKGFFIQKIILDCFCFGIWFFLLLRSSDSIVDLI
jgi:hypothetical protein